MVRFASTSASWLNYPYPRAGSEGLILYETLIVKRGGDTYAPITPDRFISGPYPPVYYWLAASVLPDALPDFSSPAGVTSIFEPGRLISLGATLIAALAVALLAGLSLRSGGKRNWVCGLIGGMVAGAVFLAMPQVLVWATRFRGDMLMIALTAAGLVCVALGTRSAPTIRLSSGNWAYLVAAAALFSIAFYTKQTALAGPMAAALFLLVRDWRAGLKWCAVMLGVVLVPFVVLEIATGNWFYLKMVTYHSLPIRALTLERLLQFAFWEDEWPVILLTLAYLLFMVAGVFRTWRAGRAGDQAPSQPWQATTSVVPYFVLAALVTLPTGAVVGADHNHLLMPGLAVAASVGSLVTYLLGRVVEGRGLTQDGRPWGVYVAGGVAGVLLLGYLLFTSEPSSWYNPDLQKPSAEQQEQMRKIVWNVHENPGTVFFADDPGVLALAGKLTPYDDPFTMTALAPQNRWDEAHFREQLRGGKFALLILSCDVTVENSCRGDTFTPGVLDAIRAGYDLLFRDVLFTYAPKSGQ
jgi:4-amino-4-deoxy-L-arabinose transferase-like glycosyltransferase